MLKSILLTSRIIAAFAVALTGILGIVGKSTDDFGNLTEYGKTNLLILIFALILGIATIIIEHFIQEKTEKKEQTLLVADISRQNIILEDIKRSFYAINSIDIFIHIDIPAASSFFYNYKTKIEKFLNEYIADKETIEKEYDKKLTTVILNSEQKLKDLHQVYSVVIKDDSPLFPKDDLLALSQLSPVFHVLLTDTLEFKELYNPPQPLPLPVLYLDQVSDMVIFAPTLFEKHKSSISYSPTYNTFSIITRTDKATIIHDNGKVISILDLPGKYLVLFSGVNRKDFELKELRIQFNKSESKNYNSLISVKNDMCKVIEGPMWKALIYKLPKTQ